MVRAMKGERATTKGGRMFSTQIRSTGAYSEINEKCYLSGAEGKS